MDYLKVIADLTEWARHTDSVRAVVMTGSAAANDTHPLSDRDIEIFTTDVPGLLADESWWSGLGEVLVVERLENPGWHPTRLIYYAGGKLDFTLIPAAGLAGIVRQRPFQVLVDKDGVASSLPCTSPQGEQPDAVQFDECIHFAYAAALMCAKAIVREELWSAKIRDSDFKEQLLTMIEWDHRARYGLDFDTRYLGTRMNDWADADVCAALLSCWGHFDAEDTMVALRNSIDLFAKLATRTASILDLPGFDHRRLAAEVETILARRDPI